MMECFPYSQSIRQGFPATIRAPQAGSDAVPAACRKRLRQRSAAASDFLLPCSSDLEDMPTSSSRNLNAGAALPFRDAFGGGILHPQIGE